MLFADFLEIKMGDLISVKIADNSSRIDCVVLSTRRIEQGRILVRSLSPIYLANRAGYTNCTWLSINKNDKINITIISRATSMWPSLRLIKNDESL